MSENTLNAALRRLGYGTDEMTAHGFRAMASTRLNEMSGWRILTLSSVSLHTKNKMMRGAHTYMQLSTGRSALR